MREFFISNPHNDVILTFLVTIISIITTIGGVGGGGLLIPIYMLIGDFKLIESIPLTIMTILGDTIIRIFFLYNKKHPLCNKRDLIYFPPLLLISLFDANTSFLGVILSNFTPNLMTIIFLLFILSLTFYKSIKKAINTYINELKYLQDPNAGLRLVIIDGIGEYFKIEDLDNNEDFIIDEEQHEPNNLQIVIYDGIEAPIEYGDTPKEKYFNTLLMFSNLSFISVFSITRKYFNLCNYTYWIHTFGQLLVTSCIGYYTVKYILDDYKLKKNKNFKFINGDIEWNNNVISKFIFIGSVTGFVSTYIGIGGGMLTTPIMIQVGMLPEVVVATSSISTLCSCIISCINYFMEGELHIIYGSYFALCSGVGSIVGIYLSDFILAKYKKQSPIIFVVSLIVFLSIILLSVNSVTSRLIYDNSFKELCVN